MARRKFSKQQWKQERQWIKDRRNLTMGFGHSTIPGTHVLEARLKSCPMPVGVVWYRFTEGGSAIDVLNIFVYEPVQRCGLATYLLEWLFYSYPTVKKIVTDSGTKQGLPFIKSVGFVQTGHNWTKTRSN